MQYIAIFITGLITLFSLINPPLNESNRAKLVRHLMLLLSLVSTVILAILVSQSDKELKVKDDRIKSISNELDSIKIFNRNLELRTIDNAMLISGLNRDTVGSALGYAELVYDDAEVVQKLICRNLERSPMYDLSIDITDIDSISINEKDIILKYVGDDPEGEIFNTLIAMKPPLSYHTKEAGGLKFLSGVPEKIDYPVKNSRGEKKILVRWRCKSGMFFQELLTKRVRDSAKTGFLFLQASRLYTVDKDKKKVLKIIDPHHLKPDWDREFEFYIFENYFYFNPVPGYRYYERIVTPEMKDLIVKRRKEESKKIPPVLKRIYNSSF